MKALLIPPARGLTEEVLRNLLPEGRDYSSNLVVFPGKRPSFFLRKAIAGKEGEGFIPPRILSMDEFVDMLFEEGPGQKTRKLESLDAVALIHEIHGQMVDPLGGGRFSSLDAFFPLGIKIYQALEELFIAGVEPKAVREIEPLMDEAPLGRSLRDLSSLSHLYQVFYERIREGGFSTRSFRYRVLAERIGEVDLDRYRRIVLAGFFALTASEGILFQHLLRWPQSLFLLQEGEGIEEKAKALGILPETLSIPVNEPEIHFHRSPDIHGQVFAVGALLREMLDRGDPIDEGIAIVLPSSSTLFPVRHWVLSLLDPDRYNISLRYPLQRTPLYGFFHHLMRLISTMEGDRLYLPHYLAFVLHPYAKNIYFEGDRADITRMLFHALEEGLRRTRARQFLSLEEIENDSAVREAIEKRILESEHEITYQRLREHLGEIHRHTIEKMRSFQSLGDFARKVSEIIDYLHTNSSAHLHPLFHPYAEAFLSHLDQMGRSLMSEQGFEEVTGYFTLFRRYMMTRYMPFEGTPLQGLQVLGFLETRGLKFDRVILLDANEGILPETSREDPLLPFQARRILGLPTYIDREGLAAYYFDTLIKGAREVHLFYVQSDQTERSRLVERLLWERQKRERSLGTEGYIRSVQYRIELRSEAPQPVKKTEAISDLLKGFHFSATSLTTYLQCSLRFYYRYVLNLERAEEISEDLDQRDIGIFVHEALREYFRGKEGKVLREEDLDGAQMEKIIDHCFERRYGREPVGQAYLLRHQFRRHLREFLGGYQLLKVREKRTQILHLEHPLKGSIPPFVLFAQPDRIERRGDRIAIIDYKTSSNDTYLKINFKKLAVGARETWSHAIQSLQLPIYLIVCAQALKVPPEQLDPLFLLLGKSRLGADIEVPLFSSAEEFHDHYEPLLAVCSRLLEEIIDPALAFTPAAEIRVCERCDYGDVCRNQEAV